MFPSYSSSISVAMSRSTINLKKKKVDNSKEIFFRLKIGQNPQIFVFRHLYETKNLPSHAVVQHRFLANASV